MSGLTNILPPNPRPRNGNGQSQTIDNRILIKTTQQFFLRNILVPSGSIGKGVDFVRDGQLYPVDFGLPIVARIEPGSPLIELINLAHERADPQAHVNRFEAGLAQDKYFLSGHPNIGIERDKDKIMAKETKKVKLELNKTEAATLLDMLDFLGRKGDQIGEIFGGRRTSGWGEMANRVGTRLKAETEKLR